MAYPEKHPAHGLRERALGADPASFGFDRIPEQIQFIVGDTRLPRVMRQMPRLLSEAGLEIIASFQHVVADIRRAHFWLSALEAFRKLVPKAGAMSEEEAAVWINGRLEDSRNGVFFAACNYYSYVVRRPN
jgi:hypothetical protein